MSEATESTPPSTKSRKWLLTQNHELRDIGAFNWTLPAFVVQLSNGQHFNTCPSAGVCASVCYARNGTFNFPSVKQSHVEKLEMVLYDLDGWKQRMKDEIAHRRYTDKWIRIHDSGDFFSDEYLLAWLEIARESPRSRFYCYTKEVERFRRIVENRDGEHPGAKPDNFFYLYSFGGKQDRSLDENTDRVADIFPSFEAMEAAGYSSQHQDDTQCVTNENNRVGIPYNNIPHFKKKIKGRTFQQMQREADEKRELKKADPEEARLRRLASGESTGVLCPCGNPYAGKPAEGCHRWGHAVQRSADRTVEALEADGVTVPSSGHIGAVSEAVSGPDGAV